MRNVPQVIRIEEVLAITGLSRSMIYKLMREEKFPRPLALGERAVGWVEVDVLSWIESRRGSSVGVSQQLPTIYLAGRMGEPENNKTPGREQSCWRMFDVSASDDAGDLEMENSDHEVLIALPEEVQFVGSQVRFMYSGPWKASGSNHGYFHGITSCNPDRARDAAYRGALQGIQRADAVIAYLDDLEAFGTIAEIGYAKALGKRLLVITGPGPADWKRCAQQWSDSWADQAWFAIRMADRHIELTRRSESSQLDYWRQAHLAAAAVVAEWYPISPTSVR